MLARVNGADVLASGLGVDVLGRVLGADVLNAWVGAGACERKLDFVVVPVTKEGEGAVLVTTSLGAAQELLPSKMDWIICQVAAWCISPGKPPPP